jgi:hypothetical protein
VSSTLRMKQVMPWTLLGILILALHVSGEPAHHDNHAHPKGGDKKEAHKEPPKHKDHPGPKPAPKPATAKKNEKKAGPPTKTDAKKAVAVVKTGDPKGAAAAKRAQAHHEAALKERHERDRLAKERLQKLPADRRHQAETVYRREHELRTELHRQHDQLRERTLRAAGGTGPFAAVQVTHGPGHWRIWDRPAYDRLAAYARTHPDATFRAAVNRANAWQRLTAAERVALIRARDALLYDTALAAAVRAGYRQSLYQALWQDNFLAREAAYRQAFADLFAAAMFQPAVAGTAPVVVAGIVPTANTFLIPAPGGTRAGSGVVQLLPDAEAAGISTPKAGTADAEASLLIDDGGAVRQTTRYLRLANATARPVRVFLTYHTEVAGGPPQWFPAAGKDQKPLTITLKPGAVVSLRDGGWRIHADRVRLWAEADGQTWAQFRTEPLWLVPEVAADGRHAYAAPVRDVFTYTFQ